MTHVPISLVIPSPDPLDGLNTMTSVQLLPRLTDFPEKFDLSEDNFVKEPVKFQFSLGPKNIMQKLSHKGSQKGGR